MTLVNKVQLPKALVPILVTELGIVTLVKVVRLLINASARILVTLYLVPLLIKDAGITEFEILRSVGPLRAASAI